MTASQNKGWRNRKFRLADVKGADDGGWDIGPESLQEEILTLVDENRTFRLFPEPTERMSSCSPRFENFLQPPFADAREITIVRPVAKLSLGDYEIDPKLIKTSDHHEESSFAVDRVQETTLAKQLRVSG